MSVAAYHNQRPPMYEIKPEIRERLKDVNEVTLFVIAAYDVELLKQMAENRTLVEQLTTAQSNNKPRRLNKQAFKDWIKAHKKQSV
jgi:SPX domain protein involved in polyphosphate accumulation